jgi:predicted  nucleic acid-binding Zn-ribbon protein
MGSEALMEKVRQLKKSLEEIEKRLAAGELPRGALAEQVKQLKQTFADLENEVPNGDFPRALLEDFQSAVDHVRMTVWALLSAPETDPSELSATVIRARMNRTENMCRQIAEDIESHNLTIESLELKQLHAILRSTLSRIDRLYKSGL